MKFFIFLLSIFLPATCLASTLNDMHNNPLNYLAAGSLNREISLYIDKNSIYIQKSAPPNYIIAFTEIAYIVPVNAKSPSEISVQTYLCRYKFNLDEQKMYQENGNDWQEIIPSSTNIPFIAKGEIIFCLAYNKSFYDVPTTIYLQFYLKNGRWLTVAGRD